MGAYKCKQGGSNTAMQMLKHWCLLHLMFWNSRGIFFSWKSSCLIWSLWDVVWRKLISWSGMDYEFYFHEYQTICFCNSVLISSVRMGTQESSECNCHDFVTGRWGWDKISLFSRFLIQIEVVAASQISLWLSAFPYKFQWITKKVNCLQNDHIEQQTIFEEPFSLPHMDGK